MYEIVARLTNWEEGLTIARTENKERANEWMTNLLTILKCAKTEYDVEVNIEVRYK